MTQPNPIINAIIKSNLSGLKIRILLYLFLNDKPINIPLPEWALILNATKSNISHALSELEQDNFVTRKQIKQWRGYFYSINHESYEHSNIVSISHQNHSECVRCGSNIDIESHHIIPKSDGGDESDNNKEPRCSPCHDYEHARRNIISSITRAQSQNKINKLEFLQKRLKILEELNTPELIRKRGTYLSWWTDRELRVPLPA